MGASPSGILCIHDRKSRDVHDLFDFCSTMQYVYRLRHVHQNRPDDLGSADAAQQPNVGIC
jgi:hypothetical protein